MSCSFKGTFHYLKVNKYEIVSINCSEHLHMEMLSCFYTEQICLDLQFTEENLQECFLSQVIFSFSHFCPLKPKCYVIDSLFSATIYAMNS